MFLEDRVEAGVVAMKNSDIAKVLEHIAELLELKGEIPFKVRAYQRAARTIEGLPHEVAQLAQEGKLRSIPGVGEVLDKKLTELVATGRLQYYEDLKAEFPPGITTLMEVPGIGPKTAHRLSTELGVTDLEKLEQALLEGKVASLYRLGDKTAENLLRHLQALRRKDRRIPIGEALPRVEEIIGALKDIPGVRNLTEAGSLRRFKETIGDIDLMGTADSPEEVLRAFTGLPQVKEVLAGGTKKVSVLLHNDLQVDLRIVEDDSFGSLLQYFTGSKDHNVILRERGVKQGLKLSEYGITTLTTGQTEKFPTEEGFYRRLGLQYIPPEVREGQREIELAAEGAIPRLVELGDIRGDLHVHTDWSDGHDSLEAMARAAMARGYRYMAITDHSVGRAVARGLNEERLRAQREEIQALNQRLAPFHIFTGVELDIRADGHLDFPDAVLLELDIVVASVHSAMGQDKETMTQRLLQAIRNPHVDIIAHPTCRLLGEREPIEADMEAVFKAAAAAGTALEINAMPQRLDLKD
ncbi:MAG: DNA polymerase/3'-5' exonuclease PolX, partial [Chloroflexota bacterium]|nr:DNA polymerase/3'-5' exonuclease PolX [Chloroflexota bacterium]